MTKIAIAVFSTFWGRSFKSKQLQALVNTFENKGISYTCYALDFSLKYILIKSISNIRVSSLPLITYKFYEKFGLNKLYNSYWNYLIAEFLYFLIYKKSILKSDSDIIVCRNRPFQLLSYIKRKSDKRILLEVDQLHPLFTQQVVLSEAQRLNIELNSIYTEKIAINNYIKAFEFADFIVVYSEYQRSNLLSYGINKPIYINELGTDLSNLEKLEYTLESEIAFVCFANHSILKGTHLLIDAWIKGGIRSKLFIVGSQEVEFKLILARYSAIPDSVIFVESFTSEELKRLSRKFNLVGMLNSLSEGYSRVVNEYLALGLPVILSEVNSRPNIDNISGYIVNSFDIQGIINAVDQLKNAIKYNEFRKNCMSRPVRTYQDFASTYVQIIQSIR